MSEMSTWKLMKMPIEQLSPEDQQRRRDYATRFRKPQTKRANPAHCIVCDKTVEPIAHPACATLYTKAYEKGRADALAEVMNAKDTPQTQ